MTELHFFVAIFERNGDKVDIIPTEYNGYWVEVENHAHQRVRVMFNSKGQYIGMCPLEL